MKSPKIRNIFRVIVCTVIGAYVFLLAFLNFSPTEQWLTRQVAQGLSEKLGTKVSIAAIEVGLFNRLIINDVEISDLQGKTMLKARHASVKLELRSLFKEQLSLRTVSLIDAQINLYKQKEDSAANYQFVVDALSSKDKHSESKLNLRINSIILRRVSAAYNEHYKVCTPGRFNTHHLNVSDLNANISLKSITPSAVDLRVRSLSLREASGVVVNRLTMKLYGTQRSAQIEDFCLEMPHSYVRQGFLLATYDVRQGFSSLLPTLRAGATMEHIQVAAADIRPFVALPTDMNLVLKLSTTFLLTPQKWHFSQLSISDPSQQFSLKGNLTLKRLHDCQRMAAQLTLSELKVAQPFTNQVAHWAKLPTSTANILSRLGDVEAKGNVSYAKDNIVSSLMLHSGVGVVDMNGRMDGKKVTAEVKLTQAQPDRLLANVQLPTQVNLTTRIQADLSQPQQPQLAIVGDLSSFLWNDYTYHSIHLKANYAKDQLQATVQSLDNNARLEAEAKAHLRLKGGAMLSHVRAKANVHHFAPAALGLHTAYKQATFSGNVQATIDDVRQLLASTHIDVEGFRMQDSPRGDYSLQHLTASVNSESTNRQSLRLRSDFLDADMQGNLNPARVKDALFAIVNRSLPGLLSKASATSVPASIALDATLKRTDFFQKMLGFDFQSDGPLRAHGNIDAGDGHTSLTVFSNRLTFGETDIIKPSIYLHGEGTDYHCLVQAQKGFSGENYNIAAQFDTHGGALTSNVSWRGANDARYNGSVESETRFLPTQHGVDFRMHIRPTSFALADTLWNISSGDIAFENKRWTMQGISIDHRDQGLTVNGTMAPGHTDSIVAQLRNIDVDYILQLVNFDAVSFGGQATGHAVFTQKDGQPQLHANIHIPAFLFNQGLMGNAFINANWNKRENRINLDADMRLPHTEGHGTHVKGYVSLAEKGLDLHMTTNHTRLDFLRRYIDGIFGDFNGEATGPVRLYGPFKKLDFEGNVAAKCSAKVLATGVSYEIDKGNVTFGPGSFAFHDFVVSDGRGGYGTANGELRHQHLKKLAYDFDITANRMRCFDLPQQPGLPFYSTTSGTGSILLSGYPGHLVANVALQPTAPTTFTYNLGQQSAFSKDDRMIHFHALQPPTEESVDTLALKAEEVADDDAKDSETDIQLNLLIDVNPSAQIRIITDEKTGDAITSYGNGTLRANWHNKGAFQLFGTYVVDRGQYNLSLQNVIRKSLVLQSGSRITFGGNPLDADLDLRTLYTVNGVPLSDLNYASGFNNKSVRADCLLNIGGKTRAPQVTFDLDLHNISSDEKQMVRQLISTQEDMSRQVIALLGVGRFLTTNNLGTATSAEGTSSQQSADAMRSFLSTTLTSQLNSAISSALGSQSRWSFGTNFMPGTQGWNNMEVDGLLQGRLLNDRLLINGNFGYRDSPTYTSNFVGDFDIRYLLTPRGNISLRAYSETNDRYFTKSTLTTQGVGITLQRDFTNFRTLFRSEERRSRKANKK